MFIINRLFILLSLQFVIVSSHNAISSEDFHIDEMDKGHIHGVHKECALPKSTVDIINCAIEFHPSVKRGELGLASVKNLKLKASQVPNPTLSSRFVEGENNGEDVSELEANLSFTVELGGKRSSRKEVATSKQSHIIANNEITKSEVKIATILNLYRLRQILTEKNIVNEALVAFSKVIEQLKTLPRLSAEKEASLILFQMAFEETKISKSEIFEEERELEHYFHIATGHSLSEIFNFLPQTPNKWPTVGIKKNKGSSANIKKLKSLTQLAQSQLKVEESNAWPNLKIGPSLAIEKESGVENKMVGLNIQIPIPLFQVNGGAKAYARSELLRAKKNIEFTQAEENHERVEQLKVYQSSVRILNKTMKQAQIERKHKKIEKLYLRGVVSSSVFLDSLKQKLSYLKSRNHRELTAVKALWNIYKYDGKVLKEKL